MALLSLSALRSRSSTTSARTSGLQHSDATSASLLLNFEAVLTVLFGRLFFGELIGARVWIASLLVLLGACALVAGNGPVTLHAASGLLAVLLATTAWAIDNTLMRPLSNHRSDGRHRTQSASWECIHRNPRSPLPRVFAAPTGRFCPPRVWRDRLRTEPSTLFVRATKNRRCPYGLRFRSRPIRRRRARLDDGGRACVASCILRGRLVRNWNRSPSLGKALTPSSTHHDDARARASSR